MSGFNSQQGGGSKYDPTILDEIRNRTPLNTTIGQHVKLTRNGKNWKGCCPFHGEKSASFHVYDDHYHCFGCGVHGDVITFEMNIKKISFREAIKDLAAKVGVALPAPSRAAAQAGAQQDRMKILLTDASKFFIEQINTPAGAEARTYIEGRGITEKDVANFRLGWAPEGRNSLTNWLKSRGYTDQEMVAAGVAKQDDRGGIRDFFFGRVMFPIADRNGQVLSFGGRALGQIQPKYINGTETAVYKKSQAIYGMDRAFKAITQADRAILIEGNIDVVAMHRIEVSNAVAPMGTAITEDQIKILWNRAKEITLFMDGDKAGQAAALKVCMKALPLLTAEKRLNIVLADPGEDPDSMIAKGQEAKIKELLGKPIHVADFMFDKAAEDCELGTIEGRTELRRRVRSITALIVDREIALDWEEAGMKFITSKLSNGVLKGDTTAVEDRVAKVLLGAVLVEPALMQRFEDVFAGLPMSEEMHEIRKEVVTWWRTTEDKQKESMIRHLRSVELIDGAKEAAEAAKTQLSKAGGDVNFEGLWVSIFSSRFGALNLSRPPLRAPEQNNQRLARKPMPAPASAIAI